MGNVSLYIGLPFPKEYSKICGASDRVSSAISFRPSHISRAGYELLLGYYRNKSFRKREIMIYPYSNFPLGKKEGVSKGLLFKSVSVSSYLHYTESA